MTAIRQDEDNPAVVAMEGLMALLYPDGHPYGRPAKGTLEAVARIGRTELAAFHQAWFTPGRASLAVVGDVPPARAAVGLVVLESTAPRWVVRRGDDNPVGKAVGPALVMRENCARQRGGRGVAASAVGQHAHAVGGEYFQRSDEGRLGQGMSVAGEVERAGDARPGAVFTDRLSGSGNVIFVEGQPERRPPVARSAEGNQLPGFGGVRVLHVVGGDERGHIDQVGVGGWLARPFVCFHASPRHHRREPHAPAGVSR